jgi:hypothetical protein
VVPEERQCAPRGALPAKRRRSLEIHARCCLNNEVTAFRHQQFAFAPSDAPANFLTPNRGTDAGQVQRCRRLRIRDRRLN